MSREKLSPMQARTAKQVCRLPTAAHYLRDFWILVDDGGTVTIPRLKFLRFARLVSEAARVAGGEVRT